VLAASITAISSGPGANAAGPIAGQSEVVITRQAARPMDRLAHGDASSLLLADRLNVTDGYIFNRHQNVKPEKNGRMAQISGTRSVFCYV
jgi:hypothetical protein